MIRRLLLIGAAISYPVIFIASLGSSGGITLAVGDIFIILSFIYLVITDNKVRIEDHIKPIIFFAFVIMTLFYIQYAFSYGHMWYTSTGSVIYIIKLIGSIFWGLFLYLYIDTQKKLREFMLTSIVAAILILSYSLIAGLPSLTDIIDGTYINQNKFGAYLLLNISFLASFYKSKNNIVKIYYLLPILFLLYGIIRTGSRGAIISTLVMFAVLFTLITIRNGNIQKIGIGFGSASFILLLLTYFPVSDRILQTIYNYGKYMDTRLELWNASLEAFISNPFIGIGIGQFRYYANQFDAVRYSVHNTYLSMFSEGGIILGTMFLFFIIISARCVVQVLLSSEDYTWHSSFLIAIFVWGIFTNVENFRVFWISIGLVWVNMSSINRV